MRSFLHTHSLTCIDKPKKMADTTPSTEPKLEKKETELATGAEGAEKKDAPAAVSFHFALRTFPVSARDGGVEVG